MSLQTIRFHFTQNQCSLLFDSIDFRDFMHIGYVLVSDDTLDGGFFKEFKDLNDWIIKYQVSHSLTPLSVMH